MFNQTLSSSSTQDIRSKQGRRIYEKLLATHPKRQARIGLTGHNRSHHLLRLASSPAPLPYSQQNAATCQYMLGLVRSSWRTGCSVLEYALTGSADISIDCACSWGWESVTCWLGMLSICQVAKLMIVFWLCCWGVFFGDGRKSKRIKEVKKDWIRLSRYLYSYTSVILGCGDPAGSVRHALNTGWRLDILAYACQPFWPLWVWTSHPIRVRERWGRPWHSDWWIVEGWLQIAVESWDSALFYAHVHQWSTGHRDTHFRPTSTGRAALIMVEIS